MKRTWAVAAGVLVVAAVFFAFGIRPFSSSRGAATQSEQKTIYHCPMHPQYTSDQPGDCPICGMRLVKVETEDGGASADNSHAGHAVPPAAASAPAAPSTERKVLYWTDAMNPGSRFDKPGKAPDGMDLVPVYADETAPPEASQVPGYAAVKISAEQQGMMGIVMDEARIMELDRSVSAVGKVAYDETRLAHVHTRFEGYIEEIFANFVGDAVKQDDPLFSVYAPELVVTENEYLLALKGGQPSLKEAAEERLRLWDVPSQEIERLKKSGQPSKSIVIRSPLGGFVVAKSALQGMRITPIDVAYDIADLTRVWVLADIYEMDLPFVHAGQSAQVTLISEPGRVRDAKLVYLYPTVEEKTRTVKVRLELDNSAGDLKPDMFCNVEIKSSLGRGLVVPDSAVLSTGERKIVFVQKGDGLFEPREVVTGVKVRNYYEIKQGVSAGEKVVTGANFLLDSESKLKASVSEMAGGHKH